MAHGNSGDGGSDGGSGIWVSEITKCDKSNLLTDSGLPMRDFIADAQILYDSLRRHNMFIQLLRWNVTTQVATFRVLGIIDGKIRDISPEIGFLLDIREEGTYAVNLEDSIIEATVANEITEDCDPRYLLVRHTMCANFASQISEAFAELGDTAFSYEYSADCAFYE